MTGYKHDFKRSSIAVLKSLEFAEALVKRPPLPPSVCGQCAEHPDVADAYTKKAAASFAKPLHVSAAFDGGNVEVVGTKDCLIDLKIRRDPFCAGDDIAHAQWFYYRVTGAKGRALEMNIINAGEASFPEAWAGARAVASYDMDMWFRVPTEWMEDTGILRLRHTPEQQAVRYAFFAPYDLQRHAALIAHMQMRERVTLHVLGTTIDGRDMELLQVGEACPHKLAIWVIHRQHPGESMAEWFAEGLLERLTNHDDNVSRALLAAAVVYVVPNMNPDGSFRGYLRTNAAGANLNREWDTPTMERSPEVYLVRNKMEAWGCDLFLDIHGEEQLPVVFTASAEGIPSWNASKQANYEAFQRALQHAAPVYQTELGYEDSPNEIANMGIACNWAAERQQCLSMTLEMPFKDALNAPDNATGWSTERSKKLGADILTAIVEVLPLLRTQRGAADGHEAPDTNRQDDQSTSRQEDETANLKQ